jgi:hypothetical protein
MGVVFYRLTTARLPFKGETPFAMAQSQVNDMPTPIALMRTDLPPWVEQIIARALAKAPELRFQSAVEFHEALARCLAGLSMTQTAPIYAPAAAPTEAITAPAGPAATGTISSRFQTAAPDAPTGFQPQPSVNTSADPTGSRPLPIPPAPKKAAISGAMVAAALVIVLAVVGGWLFMSSRSPQHSTAPATTPANPSVDAANTPASASAPPAGSTPVAGSGGASALPPAPGTSTGTSATGAARGTTPPPPAANPRGTLPAGQPGAPAATSTDANARGGAAGTRSAQPPAATSGVTTPPATPAVTPPPADARPAADPTETQVVFPDVKVLMISGRRAQDQDALLSFVGGQLTVLNRQGGTVIASTAYKAIERATYTRARNPKWDPSFFSPPDNLDLPGILPTARHWLVLQNRTSYLILQLNGNTWQKVVETVEGRTGVKVDRAAGGN